MWNYMFSYFRGNNKSEDLSLEAACNVLKTPVPVQNTIEKLSKEFIDNSFSNKIGTVTQITNKKYVIDNLYVLDKTEDDFQLGSKVLYDLIITKGKERVLNVCPVDNEWDLAQVEDSLWNTRVIICKVEKRVNRNLFLSPGEIVVNMNTVSLEFIPMVGDWLELDVKCTVNEQAIDLSGKIIEINKISPVRSHIETGKITNWNSDEEFGIVNKSIFFNKESLGCGYIPVMGDKIIAHIIESEQNRCTWRALRIIPEYMTIRTSDSKITNLKIPDFETEHSDLDITGLDISFEKLNITTQFSITVSNISKENFILTHIEFLNKNSQCSILKILEQEVEIPAGNEYKIPCECTSKNICLSREFLLLTFNEFSIGKWVNINVSLSHNKSRNSFENKPKLGTNKFYGNEVVRGQKSNAATRFVSVKIPFYSLPQKLFDTICKYDYNRDTNIIIEELKVIKPALFNNLMYINYEDKFHTLLHLDEIANLIAIRNYEQDRACFIANGEYLMLEIENLSECRPSIVLGDKILATDPLNERKIDFEGFVHKVGAKHVYLKFSQLFHDQYNGEDYSIRVIPGRSSYRRLHHAIYLAGRNLGPELLFPTRLYVKNPQVKFSYDPNSSKIDSIFSKISNKSNRVSENTIDNLSKETGFELKLEWYNNKLNLPQKNAVINILWGTARPLPYLIFGPPGTGKTVTVIETVLQIMRLLPQSRLLITAPSNSAADLIAIRLIDSGILKPGDLVRLVSYNYALGDSIPPKLVPYCATGSSAKEGTFSDTISDNGIHLGCSQAVIGRHRITVSTCNTAGQLFSMGFPRGHFSHIIIDEAAQAAEPDVMIPLSFLDKASGQVILAGDPMQLGPVVICKIASQCGLSESYLERLIYRFPYVIDPEGFPDSCGYDSRLVTKLVYNYRSLPDILGLYSSLFYNNELIATIDDEISEEANIVNGLKDILPLTIFNKISRLVFHGVDGDNFQGDDSPSWYNPHEAAQVFYYVNELYRLGLSFTNIGVITPYIKQVKEIRLLFAEAEFDIPKIGTVEEFQGQEFDVIILSTVRSCQEYISSDVTHSLGFVASPKRLNVAISRSKALLIVIGNPNLLCSDTYWRSVVKYCVEKGCYTGCELSA